MSMKTRLLGMTLVTVTTFGATGAMAADTNNVQGLYSADELMDADVYLKSDSNREIGDVEDILLGEDMSVQAIVIDAEGLDNEGNYVIKKGDFTVQTSPDDNLDNIEYRVTVDMDEKAIAEQPQYTNDWWQSSKAQAADAWDHTKKGAQSAWNSTKSATANLLDSASDAIDN
ncbi:PRC-barrel domain containing protein [Larsenimonas salina]|uniref:PRC-barrel domain containing protein n=1 Tax=Larsenimonas salina TaxID=1295565 RepID=UPI00207308DB|nr:PRC-barrel domain containing protein [Larsenimonas salina]MCM5704985.1 PRC-barrel domain containing protein [Larsenimonas salina]